MRYTMFKRANPGAGWQEKKYSGDLQDRQDKFFGPMPDDEATRRKGFYRANAQLEMGLNPSVGDREMFNSDSEYEAHRKQLTDNAGKMYDDIMKNDDAAARYPFIKDLGGISVARKLAPTHINQKKGPAQFQGTDADIKQQYEEKKLAPGGRQSIRNQMPSKSMSSLQGPKPGMRMPTPLERMMWDSGYTGFNQYESLGGYTSDGFNIGNSSFPIDYATQGLPWVDESRFKGEAVGSTQMPYINFLTAATGGEDSDYFDTVFWPAQNARWAAGHHNGAYRAGDTSNALGKKVGWITDMRPYYAQKDTVEHNGSSNAAGNSTPSYINAEKIGELLDNSATRAAYNAYVKDMSKSGAKPVSYYDYAFSRFIAGKDVKALEAQAAKNEGKVLDRDRRTTNAAFGNGLAQITNMYDTYEGVKPVQSYYPFYAYPAVMLHRVTSPELIKGWQQLFGHELRHAANSKMPRSRYDAGVGNSTDKYSSYFPGSNPYKYFSGSGSEGLFDTYGSLPGFSGLNYKPTLPYIAYDAEYDNAMGAAKWMLLKSGIKPAGKNGEYTGDQFVQYFMSGPEALNGLSAYREAGEFNPALPLKTQYRKGIADYTREFNDTASMLKRIISEAKTIKERQRATAMYNKFVEDAKRRFMLAQ